MDRQPVVQVLDHNRKASTQVRRDMKRMRTLDAETYMLRYPGMTFFWKEQNNGDVDRWLGLGAELVIEKQQRVGEIKGYQSRKGNTWVCRNVGYDQAKVPRIDYLMMMSEALYFEVKLAPERERNISMRADLERNRKAGVIDGEARGTSDLPTYAPNLPTGGVGFEKEIGPLPTDA